MIKLTRTNSGMSILTVKAFGLYANVSFGKSRKAERHAIAFDYFGATVCAVMVASALLAFSPSDARANEPAYAIEQVINGNVYVVDYDLTAEDCAYEVRRYSNAECVLQD